MKNYIDDDKKLHCEVWNRVEVHCTVYFCAFQRPAILASHEFQVFLVLILYLFLLKLYYSLCSLFACVNMCKQWEFGGFSFLHHETHICWSRGSNGDQKQFVSSQQIWCDAISCRFHTIYMHSYLFYSVGRAIDWAVSPWLPTTAASVRGQSGHVGFVVNKVALGQVFSEYFGFPANLHSTY
jgi:hypothetical protein